jgi:predicted LPLAT superfamily acyltransferase
VSTEPAELAGRVRAPRAHWARHRERGSVLLLRAMTFISLYIGRSAGRFILYFVAAYFFAFAPSAGRHSRRYLRRALGREPTALDRFRHILSFASTIHDRVYLVNGQYQRFAITTEGESLVRNLMHEGSGAFLMGAHLGSFEVTRALGQRQEGLRVAMAMYEENAHKVNARLAAINPAARLDVIALGRMEAMLRIREYLDAGAFVGVLGDRTLGEEPGQVVSFLGEKAHMPTGAMRAAAILRRPVIFMAGLYCGGNRYHIVFEPLADFSTVGPGEREVAVREAVVHYAELLQKHCRAAPYNWFNFYDFWGSPSAPQSRP